MTLIGNAYTFKSKNHQVLKLKYPSKRDWPNGHCCYSTPNQGQQFQSKLGSKLKPVTDTNDIRNLSTSHVKLVKHDSNNSTKSIATKLPVHEVIKNGCLNILTLNVCGLKSPGRADQVLNLLVKLS